LKKLIQASKDAVKLPVVAETSELGVDSLIDKIYDSLCDDLNTPVAISHIFDAVKIVNQVKEKQLVLSQSEKEGLVYIFNILLTEILGLKDDKVERSDIEILDEVIKLLLDIRSEAKRKGDFTTSDKIRNNLKALGIEIRDTKEGTEWSY